jgi:hypothetical protein
MAEQLDHIGAVRLLRRRPAMSLLFIVLFLTMLPMPLLAAIAVMERRGVPARKARTDGGMSFR